MNDTLLGLAAAVDAARSAWGEGVEGKDAASLVALNDALGSARRLLDAAHAQVATEIARQSRAELGRDGLARKQGFRSPVAMVADTTGVTGAEAARLLQVGEVTAPRLSLTGEELPAKRPHIAAASRAGLIGTSAAAAIASRLDKVAARVAPDLLDAAEQMLVERAPGLTSDQLSALLLCVEAHLDPDGLAPKEDELRSERFLRIRQEPSGAIGINGQFDPEGGSFVVAALQSLVSAGFRGTRTAGDAGGEPRADAEHHGAPVASDERSLPQRQADALVDACRHLLGCESGELAGGSTTVVVRIDLADLESGTGQATIDGIAQPITASAARRMAADAHIIPAVLGGESEVLDWGRAKRLFTAAQRLALVLRDGGCAFCGLPPAVCEAHHLRWWDRDAGPTDLSNGILLCTRCHHRVHDDGWEIRIEGTGTRAKVWFIPPAWLDASRTPRLGGVARYGLAA
jgi:5-methylcytosine-specific restriction protein A